MANTLSYAIMGYAVFFAVLGGYTWRVWSQWKQE